MTELLNQAIGEIEKLPTEEQDAIAARILSELADEQTWREQFRATTDAQWEQLAESVRRDIAAGDVVPLESVIPPRVAAP